MDKIRRYGTIAICGILAAGFILIMCVLGSYILKLKGKENSIVNWFTQNASVDISWLNGINEKPNKYEKSKNVKEKYVEFIKGAESTIETFCTSAIPKIEAIKMISATYQDNILMNKMEVVVGGKTNQEYANEAFESILRFSNYLMEKDIDFTYVQLPVETRINAYSSNSDYPKEELDLPDKFAVLLKPAPQWAIGVNTVTIPFEAQSAIR